MKSVTRRLSIAAVTLLALTLSACHKPESAPQVAPQVAVAKVVIRKVQDWDEYTGRLQAVDSVEIRPRVSGYVEQVAFAEGKLVKRGDLLFLIDPRPYQADYDRANAELVSSRTALDLANVELDRVRKLKDTGAVSQEEFDERLSAVHSAEAKVTSAKASLDSAMLNLTFTRVTSPIDGRVSRAEVTRGNLVTGGSNGGTLLTTVVSVSPIYVYFDASESAYLHYGELARNGQRPSSREVANPVQLGLVNEQGYPHVGHMDFVDNQLDPQTGTIRGRAVFDNADGLFIPGLYARIRLLGSGLYDATMVQDSAIGTDQSQKYVLVVDANNQVAYRPVKLGPLVDGLRVVKEGLKPDDTIVVSGLQQIHPGMAITPKRVSMETADTGGPSTGPSAN